ncbi:MAG: dihydropyrimidine dehydrogenase subunit A [Deltaproteobacteria bacterium]|nr:MAG: dihydropyrimidine dehydrogenase subunit A [Deltaproteobacteria bacterium]
MMKEIVFSSWEGKVVDNRGKEPGTFEPVHHVDIPEYFKADLKIRALIGWYGIVVRDEKVNVVDLCRSYMTAVHQHSCGKCIPCRRGTGIISQILTNICSGRGKPEDLEQLKFLAETVSATSKCDIGQSGPLPLLDAIAHFKADFEEAISSGQPLEAGAFESMKTAPCIDACPIHLDIPTYVERIKEGKFLESLDVIRERLPLPGILGRVCVRPCEEHCRRANIDKPISIKYLKRFVSDYELALNKKPDFQIHPSKKTGKVAIVGAGPAGVTCAYHLARRGHQVTIYERLGEPGGMSAMGIPDYRLPRSILRGEVEQVQKMGVEIIYNTKIGKDVMLADLVDSCDAVFIGVGAQGSSSMRVKGEDEGYKGFIPGVQYLLDINEGRDPYPDGKRVVVIGGGNVAIDCVRCSFRIGKEDVNLVYRRTRNEMPADEVEIIDAEEEGVQFHFLTTPVRIVEENGVVTGLECIRMELGEPDRSGRRRPVPVEGSEFIFDCDTVVPAIGQRTDMSLLEGVDGIETTAWGTIVVDEVTKQTTHEKVFSAGDCETGPGALITACAGGKRAAQSIDSLINGKPPALEKSEYFDSLFKKVPLYDADEDMPMPGGQDRKELEMLSPETRKYTFDEVEKGFPNQDAIAEASRCLRCYRIATVAV